MSQSEVVDLDMHLHWETDKAIRVSDEGDDKKAVWLPKQYVEFVSLKTPPLVRVTVPVWLAHKNGLL